MSWPQSLLPAAVNPFETMGLAPRFALDLEELASRQRELSKLLHPDKFVGRPATERRAALGRAIEVNEAHRALKDPLTRAQALLAHLRLELKEGEGPKASQGLLMETMERREALRDAGRRGDEEAVIDLARQVKEEEKVLLTELQQAFSEALEERVAAESPVAVRIHEKLGNLRYLRRFLDEADAVLDELF